MPPESNESEERQRRFYLRYAGLGLEFAGGVVGFVLLGWGADYWLGWSPVCIIAGAALGFSGGIYQLIRRANEIQAGVALMERENAAKSRNDDGQSA